MHATPADISLADDRDFRRAARVLNIVVLAAALLLAAVNVHQTGEWMRGALTASIGLVALASEWIARRDARRALVFLTLGIWLVSVLSMPLIAGIRSSFVMLFPFVLATVGWTLGKRWLLVMTTITIIYLVALGVSEWAGLFTPAQLPPPLMFALTSVAMTGVMAYLTLTVYQSFANMHRRLIEVTDDMVSHNAQLAVRENDMEFVVNAMPVRVAIIDNQWRIQIANRAMQEVWSRDARVLRGRSVDEAIERNGDPEAPAAWARAKRGERVEYLSVIRRRDGSTMYHQVALIPKLIDGQVDLIVLVAQDITALYLANQEVRQLNEGLEQRVEERTRELATATEHLTQVREELVQSEARATLGAMVASIAHEMGTPIGNSIITNGTLADQGKAFERAYAAGQLRKSEVESLLQVINSGTQLIGRNLERAQSLLQSYRRSAADQFSEERREFDLAATAAEVHTLMQPTLKKSPHRLSFDIPAGIVLDSYPGPLGQVLINLINNAYLHAFEGITSGKVQVRARALPTTPARVQLIVEDNGVGMSEAVQANLFKPFFSTKLGKGGTGLGMGIVEGIVRKTLGGTLEVSSVPGQGSRFTITLPVKASLPSEG